MADRQGQILTFCAVIGTVVGVISLVVGDFGLFDAPSPPVVSVSEDRTATNSISGVQAGGSIVVEQSSTEQNADQTTNVIFPTNIGPKPVPATPSEVTKIAPQDLGISQEHIITVVGVGRAPASITSPASRRAAALKAAHIVAKRDLIAWTEGAEIKSVVIVGNSSVISDNIVEIVSGRISEITTVSQEYDSETGEATVTLALTR